MTPMERPEPCRWITFREALTAFVRADAGTQGQRHIKPMHWYAACRLVIEGGFHPDRVIPHPPFVVRRRGRALLLDFDASVATGAEATVFGGLKTKDIDVVVDNPGVVPFLEDAIKVTLNPLT